MFKSGLMHILVATLLIGSVCAQSFLYSVTLSDSTGQIIPLNTTFPMVQIGLWSDSDGGGAATYTENFGNVLVTNGVFEIYVGNNGSLAVLPDLSINQYVEIAIQINSQAVMEVLTPRVRLPFLPMAVDSFRVGGMTRSDIEASIAEAGQSFSASDAVTSVLADPRIVQINSSIDLTAVSDSIELSVDDSVVSTKFAIVNTTTNIIFEVNSIGEVKASTYFGDGSNLSGLVSLDGSQTISGTKTFSDLNTHFLGTVNALRFIGDGQDLTNINASSLQNNIIDTSKLSSQAVTSGNLANVSITQEKLAINAVGSAQITDSAVTNAKLATASVMSSNLSSNLTAPGFFHISGLNSNFPFMVSTPGLTIPALQINSAGQVAIQTSQFSRSLNIGGDIEANAFYGDGSNLTGVGGTVSTGSISSEKIATGAVNSLKLSTDLSINGYLSVGGTLLKTLSNLAMGLNSHTHVNLGAESITGSPGLSNVFISVTGGKWNTATANYSFIGGGKSNRTSGVYASVLGGSMNRADGMYSSVLGGQKLTLSGSNSIGFNGSSTAWTVTNSSVASFMGVSMGIGTTNPNAILDLTPHDSTAGLLVRTGKLDSLGVLQVSTYVRIGGQESSVTTDAVLVINGNIKFNNQLRSSWPTGSGSGALQDAGTYAYYAGDMKIGATTNPLAGSKLDVVGKITAFQFEGDGSLLTGISGGSAGADSITSSELASAAVTAGNISTGAVLTTALANLSVTTSKLAASAVSGGSILNFSITSNDLVTNVLTQSMLAFPLVTGGSFLATLNLTSNLYVQGRDSQAPFEVSTSIAAPDPAIYINEDGRMGTHTRAPQAWVEHLIPRDLVTSLDIMRVGTSESDPSFIITTSGNVGIGIVQPSAALHVFTSSTTPFMVSTSINTSSLYVSSSGYVGVGMSTPSAALHVISSSTDVFRVSTSLDSAPTFLISSNNLIGINIFEPTAALHVIESSTNPMMIGTVQGAAAFVVTSSGRVGINNPFPTAALHVIESSTNPMMIGTVQGAEAFVVTPSGRVGINNPFPTAALHVIESSTNPMMIGTVQGAAAFMVTPNGKVGINNPVPTAALHIIESSTAPIMISTVQGVAAFLVTSSGRVGINSLQPEASLQITRASTHGLIVGTNSQLPDFIIDNEGLITIGAYPREIPFFDMETFQMRTSKAFKLTVSGGSLCVSTYTSCATLRGSNPDSEGTIYAETTVLSGSDYAEYFETEEALKQGEIVGINTITGKVRAYRAGDILIGIVSTSPGVVGNSFADKATHSLVALMGQVPVVREQVMIEDGLVYTLDGKAIGSLLPDGKVYINIGSESYETTELKQKIRSLEERLSEMQKQINFIMQNQD